MLIRHKLRIAVMALIAAVAVNVYYRPNPALENTHIHAGFRVYIDGVLQNYSDPKYMNYTPCIEHDVDKSPEEEQMEKAHLHEQVGDVVHVHREGATWEDLFTNINIDLGKNVSGYVNGEKVDNIMDREIESYSTVIFVVGEDNPQLGKEIVPIEHIKEIEAASELCGISE